MSLLNRRQQIALKVEGTEGTPESLGATDAEFLVYEANFAPDIEQHERQPFRDSIGRIVPIAGVRSAVTSFTTDLVGSGTLTDVPPASTILRGCGFQEIADTVRIPITSVSGGPMPAGEAVTQTTSGATGTTVMTIYNGDPFLFVHTTTGTFDTSNAITDDATGGISVTPNGAGSVEDPGGTAYIPRNSQFESVTVGHFLGDVTTADGLRHRIAGARGNATFQFPTTGNRAMIAAEFTGPLFDTIDATFLTGINFPSLTPPQFLGSTVKLHAESGTPFAATIDSLELSTGNDLQIRRDATSSAGLISTIIVIREGTGTIDPEMVRVAQHDFFNRMYNNSTGEVTVRIGNTDGNQMFLQAPNTAYSGISIDERTGLVVGTINLSLNEIADGGYDLVVMFT